MKPCHLILAHLIVASPRQPFNPIMSTWHHHIRQEYFSGLALLVSPLGQDYQGEPEMNL